jgi:hypothetical protein
MKIRTILFYAGIIYAQMGFAQQQDTLIFDATTGNYIIRYLRENPQTGERDSLVEVIFVPATKINPKVTTRVEPDSNIFLYKYRIENGPGAQQNLLVFLVQFGRGVDVVDRSTNRWWGDRRQGFKEEEFNRIFSWHGDQGLEVGWSADGFALGSSGIPGIGVAYFQGNAPIEVYRYELPYEMLRQVAALKIFPADHVARPTIVPVAPPEPFVATAFLDTLTSYKHQAFALGWIKNQGIVQSLDAKLDNAKRQLQRNNTTAARNTLQAFLNEVEALWKDEEHPYGGKQITSEAYALLKFNAEYLVSKL